MPRGTLACDGSNTDVSVMARRNRRGRRKVQFSLDSRTPCAKVLRQVEPIWVVRGLAAHNVSLVDRSA